MFADESHTSALVEVAQPWKRISFLTAVASSDNIEKVFFYPFVQIHSKLRNCLGSEKAGEYGVRFGVFCFADMNIEENEGEVDRLSCRSQ